VLGDRDDVVDVLGQRRGIGDVEHRWAVDEHNVVEQTNPFDEGPRSGQTKEVRGGGRLLAPRE
jgi:hypothetical protein